MSRKAMAAMAIVAALGSGAALRPLAAIALEDASPQGTTPGCDAIGGNLLLNCGFETGNPPVHWGLVQGQSYSQDTGLVYAGTASARVTVVDTGSFEHMVLQSACTPVVPGATHSGGAHFRASSGNGVRCNLELFTFSDSACNNSSPDFFDSGPVITSTGAWTQVTLPSAVPSAEYAVLQLKCGWYTGGPTSFDMRADEAFLALLGDQVFGDGFEPAPP